jgi:hypothetical protein
MAHGIVFEEYPGGSLLNGAFFFWYPSTIVDGRG